MTTNRADYQNIDGQSSTKNQSVHINPVFDEYDEDKSKQSLLSDETSSNTAKKSFENDEVSANVSDTDDPTMSCVTFRAIFVAILLTCLVSFTVQFFALRTSPLSINTGVVILISYVIGTAWTAILPERILSISINPGPFSVKEHALITIMASSGVRIYECMESLLSQRLFYKHSINHFNSILFILLMHFFAISISGILKRYLIWPASMIWPSSVMSCSLIRTLMHEDKSNTIDSRWPMSRSKFFWLIVLFQFLWYWLPGYIFPLLSFFSVICMIAPKNVIFSQVTGSNGLGLGAIQLDWNAWTAYLESPILVPFWAHVNIFVGFIIAIWIGTPIFYYLNIWESKKMPIISNRIFDVDGYFYDTSKVLDKHFHLNNTAYQTYGEAYLTAGYAVSFSFMFAGVSALIAHTILYYGKSIVEQFRSDVSDTKNDIHARLMSHYPEVPEWCYYGMLATTTLIAFIFFHYTELLSARGVFLSITLTLILILPTGIITAATNMTLATTIAGDFLCGLLLPGNPIGFLSFRTYTNTMLNQILVYLTNLKIGHYMKIPPRVVFPLLILSSITASSVHYMTGLYLIGDIPNICTPKNPSWRCLQVENMYTASATFGVVGLFNPGRRYFPILLALPVGFILPIISWYLWRTFPSIKWLGLVNFPLILMSVTNLPPAPAVEFPSWFLVGFIFNFILYRYANHWWKKYAFIFSAAMSCGVAICGLVIFFVFENNHIYFPHWWGLGGRNEDGCPLASANYSGRIPTNRDL